MRVIDRTILIVEDEDGVRKNIAEFLALNYSHVYEAKDGSEAYELYQDIAPDLIITDINMPKMDGLSLVEKIRETDSLVPIIIISAHSDKEKLFRAVKLNLIDYIIKPIERKTLKALIKKAFVDKSAETISKTVPLGQGYVFDHGNRMLYLHGTPVELTKHQGLLVEILVERKNQIVSGTDIFFHVQEDYTLEYNSATVRNLVKKIRKIFPDEMIINVYGSGYSLLVQENTLQEHLSKYDGLLEAVAILDETDKLIECNRQMLAMFGYGDKAKLLGLEMTMMVIASEKERILEALRHDEYTTDEIHLQRQDKTVFLAKIRCKQSVVNGRKIRTVSITDLSETLKRYAIDPLTSLRTRAVLESEFTNLIQQHQVNGEAACAIFVDIDNFKCINDMHGHLAGDDVIRKVSALLCGAVGKEDVVVRWGGDEFLVLLFNTVIDDARKLAEHLRDAFENIDHKYCQNFSCSFGLDAVRHGDTLQSLISRIDTALIQAKNGNKNCVIDFGSLNDSRQR